MLSNRHCLCIGFDTAGVAVLDVVVDTGLDMGTNAEGQHSHRADARDAIEVIDPHEGPRGGDTPGQYGANSGQALQLQERRGIQIDGYRECRELVAVHTPGVETFRDGLNGVPTAYRGPGGATCSLEPLGADEATMQVAIDLERRFADDDGGRSGHTRLKLAH